MGSCPDTDIDPTYFILKFSNAVREDQNINKYKDNLPMASSFVNTSDL